MNRSTTTRSKARPRKPDVENHGQGLLARVNARKAELEFALAEIQEKRIATPRVDLIEEALNALNTLLPGDPSNISEVVAAQLNQWLESTRYVCDATLGHPAQLH